MKKALVLAPFAAAVFVVTAASPVSAHSAPPCEDAGGPGNSDYAHHHIMPLAHHGELGAGGHTPGSHRGFSACLGVHG